MLRQGAEYVEFTRKNGEVVKYGNHKHYRSIVKITGYDKNGNVTEEIYKGLFNSNFEKRYEQCAKQW